MNQNTTKNDHKDSFINKKVIIIFIYGILSCFASVLLFSQPCIFDIFDLSNKGEIGSAIGGMTSPILTLIGAILIYRSFCEQTKANQIQREALEQQREALEQQREALEQQREAMKLQLESQSRQQFENTFFQLLTNFNSIVYNMDIRSKEECNVTYSGRDCFKFFVKLLEGNLFRNIANGSNSMQSFKTFYENYKHDLQPYYHNILTILKYIDDHVTKDEHLKKHLASILYANISDNEKQLIALTQYLPEYTELNKLTQKYEFWTDFKLNHKLVANMGTQHK